jgi:omega-6 fatty acid desaturase (delta-12 desaturase)
MISPDRLKREKTSLVSKYGASSNTAASMQLANTVVPYLIVFYLALVSVTVSYWLTAALTGLLALFTLRLFVLLHDCGHNSLFRSPVLNKVFGFILGIFCGMPQYVWSSHHAYHHATNGNWNKYRGALSILSTEEFAQLSPRQQKTYRYSRNILNAPFAGLLYFIFNPRYTWALGSLQFLVYVLKTKALHRERPLKEIAGEFKTRYWKTSTEYWHMFGNNVALLSLWGVAIAYFGAATFFTVYLISLSLAGAGGLILFTVQHNFEDAYASDDAHWNYYQAALEGTSYLVLPKFLNWFTADIAYHHIHHLSAQIPNYNLARAHRENAHLFDGVRRIKLTEITDAMRHILWDTAGQKLVSLRQYELAKAAVR